jgi:hypothetical protein
MAARSISTTSSDIDLISLLPTEPPAELIAKVKKEKEAKRAFLVFNTEWISDPLGGPKMRMARVCCTECGERFYLERAVKEMCRGRAYGLIMPNGEEIFGNEDCLCPECGAQARVIHTSAFGRNSRIEYARFFPMSFHRIGKEFACCSWYIRFFYTKDGEIEIASNKHEAYFTDGRRLRKATGFFQYFSTVSWLPEWEEKKKNPDTYGDAKIYLKPKQRDLNGTMLENSKLCQYMSGGGAKYPISYIKIYQKHKNIENLITAGMRDLITELIHLSGASYWGWRGGVNLSCINWKKKKPHEMLSMSKEDLWDFKELIKTYEARVALDILAAARKRGKTVRVRDLPALMPHGEYAIGKLFDTDQDPLRAVRYIEKQRKKYPKDYIKLGDLLDYWGFAERLGDDLSDRAIKWPQHLKAAHDQAHKRLDEEKQAILNKEFQRRFKALSEYSWEKDGMIIRPAKSQEELRKEGKALSHCVSTYADSHAQGKTAIFFIREAEHPKISFFTLELDEESLTVRQNRGKHNCARTEAVQKFEDQWIEHIRRMKNGRKQNTTARIGA